MQQRFDKFEFSDLNIRFEFTVLNNVNGKADIASILRDYFLNGQNGPLKNETETQEIAAISIEELHSAPPGGDNENICEVRAVAVGSNAVEYFYDAYDYEEYDSSYYDSIINGRRRRRDSENITYSHQPWNVEIRNHLDDIVCTGIVISQNVIISLATCYTNSVPTVATVNANRYKIGEIKYHDRFGINFDGIPRNNIALLVTDEPFLINMPICMPSAKVSFIDPPRCFIKSKL